MNFISRLATRKVLPEQFHYYKVKINGEKKNVQAVWEENTYMIFMTTKGHTDLINEKDCEILKEIKSNEFWKD